MPTSNASLRRILVTLALTTLVTTAWPVEAAEPSVVAKVNGNPITELDLQLASAEVGTDLGSLPDGTRRRVLVEYLIENELMAAAATRAGLGVASKTDPRERYWNRRGLRESYFYNHITGTVSSTDARAYYDQNIASKPPDKEVKARHILVKSREEAIDIYERIAHGADFGKMASEFSTDPGTKQQGGLLGYFGRGRMVPQFEEAAFKLEIGQVSDPVETQFGWHLIKIEDQRTQEHPKFGDIQEQIIFSLIHSKAQTIASDLRSSAKIEYIDPTLRMEVESERMQPVPR